ncbi:tripartite tricarboxylate transporter TctB family protein [Antarctobacter sp.]|uniref:tripartite tricarboxylate transporter TctB family protein n=1 Tax=Antarctobacter sp. TaxID=1872577 RepID=UPI003A92CDA2
MNNRNYQDILGGLMLIAIGGFALIYSVSTLKLGSFRRMDAGMFPTLVGGFIVVIGIALLVPALTRPRDVSLRIHPRPLICVLLSILAFALLLRPFGLIPAIVVLTWIASLADGKLGPRGFVVLPLSLVVICIAIFILGFGVRIDLLSWPW